MSLGDGEFPAAQGDHAHARGNIIVEHDDGVLGEMFHYQAALGTDALDWIGNFFDYESCMSVVFSLAYGNEERRRREELVTGDRSASAPRQNHNTKGERT
jgi:hypothetical protein